MLLYLHNFQFKKRFEELCFIILNIFLYFIHFFKFIEQNRVFIHNFKKLVKQHSNIMNSLVKQLCPQSIYFI